MDGNGGNPVVKSWRVTPWRRWRCVALVLVLVGAAAPLPAQPEQTDPQLERCRELRREDPREGLAVCEAAASALREAQSFDAAFEALMHAAQLAGQAGEPERAYASLAQARLLLEQVSDRLAAHRIARRHGQLAYAQGQNKEALESFLEALNAARAQEDVAATAISENDVGVVYWQMGDYSAALGHLEASLAAKQALGDADVASTLTNIGGLYGELGDHARAIEILQRALQLHRERGTPQAVGDVLEELALRQAALGETDAARSGMDEAWALFARQGALRESIRLALRRAELEGASAPETAREWLQRARDAARQLGRDPLLAAEMIESRLADTASEVSIAYLQLNRALALEAAAEPTLAPEAYRLLSSLAERLGRPQEALQHLREHLRGSQALAEQRHSQRLDALRVRLDLSLAESERERLQRENERQALEIARRRAHTLVLGAGALLVLAGLVLFFQRRLMLQRLNAAEERQRLELSVREARRASDALRADLRSMEWLLDRERSPALVFDASGQVRAITGEAAQRLGLNPDQARGRALVELIGVEAAANAQRWVEQASLQDDPQPQALEIPHGESGTLRLQCQRLELEEELGVLLLEPEPAEMAPEAAETARSNSGAVQQSESGDEAGRVGEERAAYGEESDDRQQRFRSMLVALMQLSLDLWERITRKTRIDLAERSGVWRITIDEGRLRVRAMDRYLSLDTLPEKPRWREVLRTAYFVLAELELSSEQREQLETLIQAVLQGSRRRG